MIEFRAANESIVRITHRAAAGWVFHTNWSCPSATAVLVSCMDRSSYYSWRRKNATIQLYCEKRHESLDVAGPRSGDVLRCHAERGNENLWVLAMHRVLLLGAGKIGRMIAR